MLPIEIRPPRNSDIPFLFDTFRRSFHTTLAIGCLCCTPRRDAPPDRRLNRHRDLFGAALAQYQTLLAVDPSSPDDIYGYVVGDKDVVAWAYTVHAFRRQGVASRLLDALSVGPTARCHWPTTDGWLLAQHRGLRLTPAPMKDPTP